MVMNGFDTDGDGSNSYHRQWAQLLRQAPDHGDAIRDRADLSGDLTGVRPDQLAPARRLLPLPADRHRRQLGVHRHRRPVPGQRGVIEIDFANTGLFMFRAPVRVRELGWMGFFNVTD